MRNSNDIIKKMESSDWSRRIAGKVMQTRREKQQKRNVMLSVLFLVLVSIPVISMSISNSGWDDYLSSWLQQEESGLHLTTEEYATIINY